MNKPGTSSRRPRWLAVALVLAAAGLLLAGFRLPLWHLRMEAPQYRGEDALHVIVYPHTMRGDLQELAVLNQYIGVHVPETLPQFRWLPGVFLVPAGAALLVLFLPAGIRRSSWVGIAVLLAFTLLIAVYQARHQMRDIGHKRDPKAALMGVKDFTPPFIGSRKIAQFEVHSRLSAGAYCAGAAIGLLLIAAGITRQTQPARVGAMGAAAAPLAPDALNRPAASS
jgi:hypothetical protein